MLKISPKLIDVEGNRIETEDKLFRKQSKLDLLILSGLEKRTNDVIFNDKAPPHYQETSRFPTQLFTNIEHEQFKYCKKINEKI